MKLPFVLRRVPAIDVAHDQCGIRLNLLPKPRSKRGHATEEELVALIHSLEGLEVNVEEYIRETMEWERVTREDAIDRLYEVFTRVTRR